MVFGSKSKREVIADSLSVTNLIKLKIYDATKLFVII